MRCHWLGIGLLAGVIVMGCGDVSGTKQRANMMRIGLAVRAYNEKHVEMPAVAIHDKNGNPLLSWRVAILPFMQEEALYKAFRLDEPWDSPHNLPLVEKMPDVYQSPGRGNDGKTSIMVFTGKGAAFEGGKPPKIEDMVDGLLFTILAVEAGPEKAVEWTKPEDIPFDPENPAAALGKVSPDGFNAVFFDGHAVRLKVDAAMLKALITPAGGEPVQREDVGMQ
jgi:prepilin-type processing-associated H-X9-DG protein